MAALAFSSLTEGALMRVEVGRARQLASEGRWGASGLLRLVEKRQEVLTTLVLLINLSIIVASAYTTELTIAYFGGSARWVPASSIGMIALLLVLCEVTPKTYAMRRPEAVGFI
jgi:Mg2+/Co2+ transporter CorB